MREAFKKLLPSTSRVDTLFRGKGLDMASAGCVRDLACQAEGLEPRPPCIMREIVLETQVDCLVQFPGVLHRFFEQAFIRRRRPAEFDCLLLAIAQHQLAGHTVKALQQVVCVGSIRRAVKDPALVE